MSDSASADVPGEPGGSSLFQNFQHTPVGARVPEKVGRGAFATAMMVLQTNDIFVIDFLAMSSQPQQITARIIMTAHSFSQFLGALRQNVKHYETEVGPLKPRLTTPHGSTPAASGSPRAGEGNPGEGEQHGGAPAAPPPHPELGSVHDTTMHNQPSRPPAPITELYEQIKFPEELLGGSFANAVMIRHTPEEFCFDFISSLYPRPIVVSRVFAAAGRVPSFIDAMSGSLGRYERGGGHPQ
jgi:hypothetical protein